LEIASPELIGLFRRAFLAEGLRPTAEEWRRSLENLQKELKVCALDKTHHYYRELNCCPWCLLPSSTGRATFNSAKYASPSGRFDAIAFSQILGSLRLLEFSGVSNTTFIGEHIQPDGSTQFQASLLVVAVVSIVLSIFLSPLLAAPISCALSGALYARFGRLSRSDKSSLEQLEDAKSEMGEFLRAWKDESREWRQFTDKSTSLQKALDRYRNLDNELKRALERLDKDAREKQLKEFLRQFKVKDALDAGEMPGISPERMQSVFLSGIETAADVGSSVTLGFSFYGITFHDVIANLRRWRVAKEANFVFDRERATSDKKDLTLKFAEIRNQIEEDVRWMLPELERRVVELNKRMVEINAKTGLLHERLENARLNVMRKARGTFSPTPLLSVSLIIPLLLSCARY
jgi:DNA-binding helix-hairpin-helix protein with protein kinase domain